MRLHGLCHPLLPRFNIGGTRGQRTKFTGAIFLTDDLAPLGPSLHNVNSRGWGVQCSIDETSKSSTMLKVVQYFFHPQYWWRPRVWFLSQQFETPARCHCMILRNLVFSRFPLFPPIYGLQIFTETRPWLSKHRQRLFKKLSLCCHIC